MNERLIIGTIIVLILAGAAIYIGIQPTGYITAPTVENKIVIGTIQPLTGSAASIGQNVRAAIEVAVEEVNAEGGINGKRLEIVFEDGKCDAGSALTAVKKLVNVDKVPAIVGPTCSSETIAAAPTAEEAGVVILSNCSSNPAITDAGDYIFRDFPSDNFQAKIAAELAYNELKAKKVALLTCLSDWCAGIREVFRENYPSLGGEIVADEKFEQEAKDLRTQLLKIREADPDLIYFVAYANEAIVGIKQAKELGLEATMLGADAWNDQHIWDSTQGANEGTMFTTVYAPLNEEFKKAMREKTGSNEITDCSPQAYDAVHLIADALKKCGENGECIKEELYKVKGYQGVSGEISFDSKGDLETANYAIKVVRNGEAVEYSS